MIEVNMKSNIRAGNYNLKGKKYKLLGCYCCEVIDRREDYLEKLALKEAKQEIDASVGKWTKLTGS